MTTASSADHPTRRDFLFVATGSVAAVGAAAAVWPLVAQMNPDASTIAAGAPIEVDLTPIELGGESYRPATAESAEDATLDSDG